MDKKLLMKVGIGAGVLVLGYLAYKKFAAKPAETKSAEATPEEELETPDKTTSIDKSVAPTKSQSIKSSIVFTEWEGDSAEIREKFKKAFGITSEDWKKMQEQVKKFFASSLPRFFNPSELNAYSNSERFFANLSLAAIISASIWSCFTAILRKVYLVKSVRRRVGCIDCGSGEIGRRTRLRI